MINRIAWDAMYRRAALGAAAAATVAGTVAAVAAGSGWVRWLLGAAVAVLGLIVIALLKQAFIAMVNGGALQGRIDALDRASEQQHETNNALLRRVDALARSSAASGNAINDALERQREALEGQREAMQAIEAESERIDQDLGTTRKALDQLGDELAATAQHATGLQRELNVGRGESYQQLPRLMTEVARETLVTDWPERLGIDFDEARLAYLERKLVDIESRCRGRIAASVDDAAVRALVASALPSRKPAVLEIGILFAVNAVYVHDVAAYLYESFHQTLVDPLDGYYGGGEPDPYGGVLVNEQVARDNLRVGGVPSDAYELIIGLSTDEAVRRQAERRSYDAVLIDGDHSYDVLSADFKWATGLIVADGFVLVDDYQGPSWPDVTRFVDDVAMKDERFEFVGALAHTAVFRRRPA